MGVGIAYDAKRFTLVDCDISRRVAEPPQRQRTVMLLCTDSTRQAVAGVQALRRHDRGCRSSPPPSARHAGRSQQRVP